MNRMRPAPRVLLAALVALCGLPLATARPAAAHFCSQPLQVPVGRPVTFTVGVPAEEVPVTRVDIELPEGFEFHRAIGFAGWQATRVGDDVVRYEGGTIRLFLCAFFTLAGVVTEKTTLLVPFVTYGEDGQKIQEFRADDLNEIDAAQLVYAGTQPGEVTETVEGGGALAAAGWALIAFGVAAAGFLMFRRRRLSRPG